MPLSSKIPILDDELMDRIVGLPEDDQRSYVFLSPHPNLRGRWYVDALHPAFIFDFEEVIGRYRTVSPAGLSEFLEYAEEIGYKVAFSEDPFEILDSWEHLNDPPAFSLNSDMPDVINGFLPFQLQGFNFLRSTDRAGLAVWSTGTGKTALEAALIKQHVEHEDYDLALVVCKANNKIDTKKKLLQLGSIDYSIILDGANTKKKRAATFEEINQRLALGENLVVITNYETMRTESDAFTDLVDGRDLVVFWDEMPTKLSNRETLLYQSVKSIFYTDKDSLARWHNRRPERLRQYDLSATPIENSPEGLFNQIRIIDPTIWPSSTKWESKFGATRDFFTKRIDKFKDLDLMGLEIEHITHQVDKKDPDIAKFFPKVQEEIIYVDWSSQDRKVYDQMQKVATQLAQAAKEGEEVKKINPLQLIGVLQMICDAPSMVQKSAENRAEFEAMLDEAMTDEEYDELGKYVSGSEAALTFLEGWNKPLTDDHCNKIDALCDLIVNKHPDEKFIVFSRLAGYIQPVLAQAFEERGISYVIYRGTEKQRQEAKDAFRTDPDIRVFLSSDIGSDSIDLPEARINVNYDLPLTYARKVQRQNRNHRVNSTYEWVIFYDLLMPDSVEDRIAEIVERKKGYHQEIFKGEIAEESISARMTAEDLWYALTGED